MLATVLALIMSGERARALASNRYVQGAVLVVGGALALAAAAAAFWLWLSVHDASVAREAKQGYVTQVMLETVQARLAEAERQKTAAVAAAAEYDTRANQAIQARDKANAKLEEAIAADRSDSCTWTADDLEWLRKH